MKIKELPEAERPYEKLELYGEKALSNAELLAIIIKTGTKKETSVQLAQQILNLNKEKDIDNLQFLKDLTIQELMQIDGIGKVKAIQIKAVCELSLRMIKPSNYKNLKINSQKFIANICMEEFRTVKKEIARVYFLNIKNMVIKVQDISIGGVNNVPINIQEIISIAIKIMASKIILVHNHPSGDSTPSEEDVKVTDKLFNAAKIFNIDLLDHLVIGNMNYTSVYEYVKRFF